MYWCRQYILFHGKRHPRDMGREELEAYLNYLAAERHVSASTQSQALNSLIFMYRHVLKMEPGWMENLERAKRKVSLPVVLTVQEVRQVLACRRGTPKLMAELIYGTGLRVMECMQLRIKDVDFPGQTITVRTGKGGKDRTTVLPQRLRALLEQHLVRVVALHKQSCRHGGGYAPLPDALARKYPNAAAAVGWQYVFPSAVERREAGTGRLIRWHGSPATLQRAFRAAVCLAGIHKQATVHTLRHCFATHLLQSGCDIRTIQTLMGHRHLETTMIYTQVLSPAGDITSPLDQL